MGVRNRYVIAGISLLVVSSGMVAYAAYGTLGHLVGAVFIMGGLSCLMGGAFMLALYREDSLDVAFTLPFTVEGARSVCTLCSAIGAKGPGIVGRSKDGTGLVHRVAVDSADGERTIELAPSGLSLLKLLKEEYALQIPTEWDDLLRAVREVLLDTLEIAEGVRIEESDGDVVVNLEQYHLIDGCIDMHGESAESCSLYPCSVGSLVACMLAEGLGRDCWLRQVEVDRISRTVRSTFSCPAEDGEPGPRGEGCSEAAVC